MTVPERLELPGAKIEIGGLRMSCTAGDDGTTV